jgi:Ca2+-binding EF-hand superfamily protein
MSLSAEQIEELKAAFTQMDANGDGFVTKDELKAMLSSLGEPVEDSVVNEMMNVADVNGDGKVDFNEFVAASQ